MSGSSNNDFFLGSTAPPRSVSTSLLAFMIPVQTHGKRRATHKEKGNGKEAFQEQERPHSGFLCGNPRQKPPATRWCRLQPFTPSTKITNLGGHEGIVFQNLRQSKLHTPQFEEQLSTHRRQTQQPTPTPASGCDRRPQPRPGGAQTHTLRQTFQMALARLEMKVPGGRASQRTGFLKTLTPRTMRRKLRHPAHKRGEVSQATASPHEASDSRQGREKPSLHGPFSPLDGARGVGGCGRRKVCTSGSKRT